MEARLGALQAHAHALTATLDSRVPTARRQMFAKQRISPLALAPTDNSYASRARLGALQAIADALVTLDT